MNGAQEDSFCRVLYGMRFEEEGKCRCRGDDYLDTVFNLSIILECARIDLRSRLTSVSFRDLFWEKRKVIFVVFAVMYVYCTCLYILSDCYLLLNHFTHHIICFTFACTWKVILNDFIKFRLKFQL